MIIPSLKANNITYLTISFPLTLDIKTLSQIPKTSLLEDGRSVFIDSYKVDGVGHRAWAYVKPIDKGADQFMIEINYQVGKGGRLGKSWSRMQSLFDLLSSIEDTVSAQCHVRFSFSRRSRYKPLIPLPMRLFQHPDAPFNEITGFHLTKNNEYNILLDIMDNGEILESVMFTHSASIHDNLVDDVIQAGLRISDRIVSKEN